MKPYRVLAMIAITLLSIPGSAQMNPFAASVSSGGSCSTNGTWTDKALSSLQSIVSIARTIKNEESCKGLNGFVANLTSLETLLKEQAATPGRDDPKNHIEALNTFRSSAKNKIGFTAEASKLLINSSISSAASAAKAIGEVGSTVSDPYHPFMNILAQRAGVLTKRSVELLNNIFTTAPGLSECLHDNPGLGAGVIMGAIRLAEAVSGRQDGLPSQLASTVGNIFNFIRDKKILDQITKLNNEDYVTSISCLLESLTENYCAAYDVRSLLAEDLTRTKFQYLADSEGNLKIDLNNPLSGYYMLVQPVPKVAQWLQKIQFGALPNTKQDADFKIDKWTAVMSAVTEGYEIYGKFMEDTLVLYDQQDLESQQKYLLRLILTIVHNMTNSKSSQNFMTMGTPEENLPFEILGLPVPPEVTDRTPPMSFDKWVYQNGQFKPNIGFDNPAQENVESIDSLVGGLARFFSPAAPRSV